MWPFKKKNPGSVQQPTLDEALEQLAKIGVRLSPEISLDDLLPSLNGERSAPVDKVLLLCALGGEAEVSKAGFLSRDIWHLDSECIEDHGDYRRLAERFWMLAGSALPISDLSDHVDVVAGTARLEFTLAGEKMRWDMKVDNDWMDPALYSRFQAIVRARNSSRFMICALGQDSLLLFGDEAKRRAISEFSGLQFKWE